MKKHVGVGVALILAFLLGAIASAQQLTPAQLTRIDSIASGAISSGRISGMTIGVARGSAAPWIHGYGLADREHSVLAEESTIYRVRSISKMFTSAAVLQLAAAGKVALDSDITKFLPDAPTRNAHITVREILSHTSGLPNYHGAVWRAHYHERLAPATWPHLFDSEPLAFTPGSEYAYSNLGFDLLALMVERMSGEKFPDYVRRHITTPLGLQSTSFCTEEAPPAKRATPYDVKNGKAVTADTWADVEYGGCDDVLDG
jgi:D-alanyl-D-alanine carboxypeptidase